jgi:prepilin-type processing-associated H-X9-DG protein
VRGQPSLLRTRSYSLDCWLNNDATRSGFPPSGFFPYLKTKVSELRSPTEIFTFIDEHEQGIDYGSMFVTFPGNFLSQPEFANNWPKMPSDRHNQGCNIAFADGHAVLKRWKAPKRFKSFNTPPLNADDLKDLRQIQAWVPRE